MWSPISSEPPFALTSLQEGHFDDVKPHERGDIRDVPGAAEARMSTLRHYVVWEEVPAHRGSLSNGCAKMQLPLWELWGEDMLRTRASNLGLTPGLPVSDGDHE